VRSEANLLSAIHVFIMEKPEQQISDPEVELTEIMPALVEEMADSRNSDKSVENVLKDKGK
jgi:hypothetical protein